MNIITVLISRPDMIIKRFHQFLIALILSQRWWDDLAFVDNDPHLQNHQVLLQHQVFDRLGHGDYCRSH